MADFIKRAFGNSLTISRDAIAREPQHLNISEPIPLQHDTSYPVTAASTRLHAPSASDDFDVPRKPGVKNAYGFGPQYTQVGAYDDGRSPNGNAGGFNRIVRNFWLKEICSLLFSVASLIAITVVLANHNKRQSHRLPAGVSLNTYLAVFATIAKAGLMYPVMSCIGQLKWLWFSKRNAPLTDFGKFDDATRGPWDALVLLGSLKFWHTASIGAVITVLAIGISPITQQAIGYPTELVPSLAAPQAQAPSSNLWHGIGANLFHPDYTTAPLSLPIKRAIITSVYNAVNISIDAVAPSCATGNCTWPAFDSLSICSKVSNVTEMLNVPALNSSAAPYLTNVSLPNGVFLVYGLDITQMNSSSDLALLTDNSTIGFMISNAYIIYEKHGLGIEEISNTTEPIFNALELVFHWCVNTFITSVDDGVPSTNIIASSSNATIDREPDNKYIFNMPTGNATISPPSGNKVYNVTQHSTSILGASLSSYLEGAYFGGAGGYPAAPELGNDVMAILQPIIAANDSALVQEGIMNYTGNIATSMTNTIRTYTGAGNFPATNPVPGTSYAVQTFVEVKWAWLSLLIGLVAASALFLLATVIHTVTSRVDVMKSNALAAVTILGPEARDYMGPAALNDGTIDRAARLRVRLSKGEKGWTLDPVH